MSAIVDVKKYCVLKCVYAARLNFERGRAGESGGQAGHELFEAGWRQLIATARPVANEPQLLQHDV
jgi:hypothetical protein